ncbi:MAG: GMC oxidoreductase [Nostoc sp.]
MCNTYGKVHGYSNLFVVDGSLIPGSTDYLQQPIPNYRGSSGAVHGSLSQQEAS